MGADTTPDLAFQSILHGLGYRFRLDVRDLPGSPDLVLPRRRTVIFVHGCFWHRHRGCRYASTPSSRPAFWKPRFAANVVRDRRAAAEMVGEDVVGVRASAT